MPQVIFEVVPQLMCGSKDDHGVKSIKKIPKKEFTRMQRKTR